MEFKEPGSKNKWPFDEGYLIFTILRSTEPQTIKYQFLIRELYIEDVIEFHLEGDFGEISSVTVNGEELTLSTDPEYRNGKDPVATVVI